MANKRNGAIILADDIKTYMSDNTVLLICIEAILPTLRKFEILYNGILMAGERRKRVSGTEPTSETETLNEIQIWTLTNRNRNGISSPNLN